MRGLRNLVLLLNVLIILASCSSSNKSLKRASNSSSKGYSTKELKIDGVFLDACTQKQLGNLDKAIELYDEVIASNPNYASAYFEKASILFSKKDVKSAIELTQKAISLQPKNHWYRLQLGEIYLLMADYENGAKVYEELIKLNPDEKDYYYQLLQIYTQAFDENNTIKTIGRIEKKWSSTNELILIQKQCYAIFAEANMKKKDYQNALKYYQKIEELDPEDPYIHASLANYYLIQKDKEKTFSNLVKSVANKELDYKTKIQVLIAVYGNSVDENQEDFNHFFTLLQDMSKQYPQEKTIWELLATGYTRNQDFKKAEESLKNAIHLGNIPKTYQPNNYQIYQSLLFLQSQLEESDSLILYAQKTIELYPEQPIPYLLLGANQLYKNNLSEAQKALEQGLEMVVADSILLEEFYSNLAQVHYQKKESDKAFAYFDKALELNPNNYIVLNNYAYYLSEEGKNLDKALQMSKKVVDKYPQMPTYIDTYAWVLFKRKEYKEAYKAMQNIINQKEKWSSTITLHYEEILKALENQ